MAKEPSGSPTEENKEIGTEYGAGPGLEDLVDETVGSEGAEEPEKKAPEKKEDDPPRAEQPNLPADLFEDSESPKVDPETEDKLVETSVEEEFPDPENASEKDVSAYKTMRERITTLQREVNLGKEDGHSALKERAEKAEGELEKINLSQSPRFQETFVKPAQEVWGQITKIAEAYSVDAQTIRAASRASLTDRDKILEGENLPAGAIAQLLPLMNDFSVRMGSVQKQLNDHQNVAKEFQAEEKTRSDRITTMTLDDAVLALRADKHFLLKDSRENPQWMPSILDGARNVLAGSMSDEDRAKSAIKAQLADHYKTLFVTENQKLRDEVANLQGRLGITVSSKPKVDSSSGPAKPGKQTNQSKTLEELADETVGVI